MNPIEDDETDFNTPRLEEGIPIHEAWLELAIPWQKKKYIDAIGSDRSNIFVREMQSDLMGHLHDERLVATGILISPAPYQGREIISPELFVTYQFSDVDRAFSDSENTLKLAGREWFDVRIYSPTSKTIMMLKNSSKNSDSHDKYLQIEINDVNSKNIYDNGSIRKTKNSGPKPHSDLIIGIYMELKNGNIIKSNHTIKEQYNIVIKEIKKCKMDTSKRGFSYKTFCRITSEYR